MHLLRNLALIGMAGGFIMLLGDYLFFLTPWVNGIDFNSITAMQTMPTERLVWGGIAGPVAALAYGLGSSLFYPALKQHNQSIAFTISVCFIVTYAMAGAAHCLFTVHGFIGADDPGLLHQKITLMVGDMAKIIIIAALLGSFLLIYMILRYRTVFPRRIILIMPITLSLIEPLIRPVIPSPLGSIITGGWPNWSAVSFFASLAVIWHKKDQLPDDVMSS